MIKLHTENFGETYKNDDFKESGKPDEYKGPIASKCREILTDFCIRKHGKLKEQQRFYTVVVNHVKEGLHPSTFNSFVTYDAICDLAQTKKTEFMDFVKYCIESVGRGPKVALMHDKNEKPGGSGGDVILEILTQVGISSLAMAGTFGLTFSMSLIYWLYKYYKNGGEKIALPIPGKVLLPGTLVEQLKDVYLVKNKRVSDDVLKESDAGNYIVALRDPETGKLYNKKTKEEITPSDVPRLKILEAKYTIAYKLKDLKREEIVAFLDQYRCVREDGKEVFPDGQVFSEIEKEIFEKGRKILQEDSVPKSGPILDLVKLLATHSLPPNKVFSLETFINRNEIKEYQKTPIRIASIFPEKDGKIDVRNLLVKASDGVYSFLQFDKESDIIEGEWKPGQVIKEEQAETIIRAMDKLHLELIKKKEIEFYKKLRQLRITDQSKNTEVVNFKNEVVRSLSKLKLDDLRILIKNHMFKLNLDDKVYWISGKRVTEKESNDLDYYTKLNDQETGYDRARDCVGRIEKVLEIMLPNLSTDPILEEPEKQWVIPFLYPSALGGSKFDKLYCTPKGELLKSVKKYEIYSTEELDRIKEGTDKIEIELYAEKAEMQPIVMDDYCSLPELNKKEWESQTYTLIHQGTPNSSDKVEEIEKVE